MHATCVIKYLCTVASYLKGDLGPSYEAFSNCPLPLQPLFAPLLPLLLTAFSIFLSSPTFVCALLLHHRGENLMLFIAN